MDWLEMWLRRFPAALPASDSSKTRFPVQYPYFRYKLPEKQGIVKISAAALALKTP